MIAATRKLNEQNAFYSVRSCAGWAPFYSYAFTGGIRRGVFMYVARQLWITLKTEHNVFTSSLKWSIFICMLFVGPTKWPSPGNEMWCSEKIKFRVFVIVPIVVRCRSDTRHSVRRTKKCHHLTGSVEGKNLNWIRERIKAIISSALHCLENVDIRAWLLLTPRIPEMHQPFSNNN